MEVTVDSQAPNKLVLCVCGRHQNMALVNRIVTDLGYQFHECAISEVPDIDQTRKYDLVLSTQDVPLHLLEALKALPNIVQSKFVLIGGGPTNAALCHELQQRFHFDLLVERPIKSSLLAVQLQVLLESDQAADEIADSEQKELNFTDKLKAKYLGVVDKRISTLEQTIKAIVAATEENKQAVRVEAQRLAHNMRGTASSCGLATLATAASQLEEALQNKHPSQDLLSDMLKQLSKEVASIKSRYFAEADNKQQEFARMNVLALLSEPLQQTETEFIAQSPLNITIEHDSDEFVKLATTMPLDAILIDLSCKSSNGFALARTLRENDKLTDLPIGFIQGSSLETATGPDCAHAGGALMLEKPLDCRSLIDGCSYLVTLSENGRPRILVVDDDEDFTSILATTLGSQGMIVRSTTNPLRTEALLQEFSADLLLVDARMPEQSGIDLCRTLRANSRWSDLPILFLTAEKGIDTRIKAYEAGADDYLSKPLIVPELLSRVKGRLERARLLRERIGKDSLTGLLLRRSFIERLEILLFDAGRMKDECSICLFDIDHFKKINDTYGHAVGDEVLSALGRRMAQRFRASDLRGRWGGEEFILAFPHTTSATMMGAVTRLLEEFKLQEFQTDAQFLSGVSFSAGLATFPQDGLTSKELLLRADDNLYKAKRTGRSRVCDTTGV